MYRDEDIVIIGAQRTPFGKFGGSFRRVSAVELGQHALQGALRQAGLAPEAVSHVLLGIVYPAGLSQMPARQVAFRAGLPPSVRTVGIDKACCSATEAIIQGARLLRSGEATVVAAGGMENMSAVPYLHSTTRWGQRMGHTALRDYLLEGLTWPETSLHMGVYAERAARAAGISRTEQDAYAAESQRRWAEAEAAGFFASERLTVPVTEQEGGPVVDRDEHPRPDTSVERLAVLPPAFTPEGDITAGNASGICDGAAVVVLTTAAYARRVGALPLARIAGWGQVGGRPDDMAATPAWAIQAALQEAGWTLREVDRVEINEAFAAVPLYSMRLLGLERDRVNVHGGAIAVGHPVGATGARLVMTLLYELRQQGLSRGVAALCGAGAQGDAILLEVDA
jgi:acetyl-CoA C-acetyltransferase